MAMSLDQPRYFVAVAEEEHLGRAAKRLHISEPPLSRQIRQLEDELELKLFERNHKGMPLREEGQLLLEELRPVLNTLAGLKARMHHRTQGPSKVGRCTRASTASPNDCISSKRR